MKMQTGKWTSDMNGERLFVVQPCPRNEEYVKGHTNATQDYLNANAIYCLNISLKTMKPNVNDDAKRF